jgi:hypothetical protein
MYGVAALYVFDCAQIREYNLVRVVNNDLSFIIHHICTLMHTFYMYANIGFLHCVFDCSYT